MLEQVDLNRSLNDDEYHERMAALKLKMYDLGHAVYVSKTPVVIVFEGWGCAGKGRAIAELTSRLDPRGFRVYPTGPANCVEREFPWLQRFWLRIPAYGEMSIFDRSWYRRVTLDRAAKEIDKSSWKQALQDIREFERVLADDGTVIVKFFLHISEKEQKRRIKRLLADKATAWQVGQVETMEQDKYDRLVKLTEQVLEQTTAEYAPWTIVPA
ncbi:MAG: polyphosphate kinase 2 family protein, partial [Rudaea sp.]